MTSVCKRNIVYNCPNDIWSTFSEGVTVDLSVCSFYALYYSEASTRGVL